MLCYGLFTQNGSVRNDPDDISFTVFAEWDIRTKPTVAVDPCSTDPAHLKIVPLLNRFEMYGRVGTQPNTFKALGDMLEGCTIQGQICRADPIVALKPARVRLQIKLGYTAAKQHDA